MKKFGLLNSKISSLVSNLGHQDLICISDAGLAIPNSLHKIDISLKENKPGLIEVLKIYTENVFVEKIVLTNELKENCPKMFNEILEVFESIEVKLIDHLDFKEKIKESKGVIRTGEFTPFSNIILYTGVDQDKWKIK